jgi:long-chain fatty acid transport protein
VACCGGLAGLALAGPAFAGGYEIVQQSAVAGGTGSASTAREDDAGAAWFNPAALADGRGLRTALGVTLAFPTLHAEGLPLAPDAPWEADTESAVSPPPHLYGSYSQDDWLVGVAANLPFASSVQWASDWQHRFDVISSEIQFFRLAPFFGWRFDPIRLAAGPQFDFGRVYLKRATNHIEQEGSSAIVLSGHGFGGHVSAFYDAAEWLAIGLSYRSRSLSSMEGDADFSVPEVFAADLPDQHVSTEWMLPDRLAAGFALRLGPVVTFLDFTAMLWSVSDTLVIHFDDPATDDRESPRNWRDSMALRFGAEWAAIDALTLRAGFYADGIPNPPPPRETLSPSSPDSTRIAGTLGASVEIADLFAVDAFYEHMRLLKRKSNGGDAPLASYSGFAHFLGLGVRLHIDPNEGTAPAQ